ncbi:protein kinase [Nocardia sp. NPDC049149]|uniref:serine/threonine-protein kinase n=1 Tax=Nocardia sp. NPDC049149 TaxID=3364315 RepID=UPI0037168E8C
MGQTFAEYLIEDVLGQGGMGTVYRARHPRLPRSVALKLLHRAVSQDEELRQRFIREANVVARLEHPGIVGIYDRGTQDGHLWISMQYIAGTDATRLDHRSTAPAHVVQIIADTADALDYAHSQGVLHRDIKPANILLAPAHSGRAPRAVLTDFGIARLLGSDTKLTATGTFTATLAYASPEQLSGEPIDHRADQYSLACTLYTLLAGQTPFPSTNPGQVITGHLTKPVPRLSESRPDLPPPLDDVIARAMAKQRQDRFPSCGEFAAAATSALHGQPALGSRLAPTVLNSPPAPSPPPAPDPWRRVSPTRHNPQPDRRTGDSMYLEPMSPVSLAPSLPPRGRGAKFAAVLSLLLGLIAVIPTVTAVFGLIVGHGQAFDDTIGLITGGLISASLAVLFIGGSIALFARKRLGRWALALGSGIVSFGAVALVAQGLVSTDQAILAIATPVALVSLTVLWNMFSPSTIRWLEHGRSERR